MNLRPGNWDFCHDLSSGERNESELAHLIALNKSNLYYDDYTLSRLCPVPWSRGYCISFKCLLQSAHPHDEVSCSIWYNTQRNLVHSLEWSQWTFSSQIGCSRSKAAPAKWLRGPIRHIKQPLAPGGPPLSGAADDTVRTLCGNGFMSQLLGWWSVEQLRLSPQGSIPTGIRRDFRKLSSRCFYSTFAPFTTFPLFILFGLGRNELQFTPINEQCWKAS